MLNKSKGNMYPWVTHTWNVAKGKCPHDCSYCYMKRYPQSELYFDAKACNTNLGYGNTIFVGSSCDLWATTIEPSWIEATLGVCRKYANAYLFQSKNPERFIGQLFPEFTTLGCTIETNRVYPAISKAPNGLRRKMAMEVLTLPKMISIEPIIDFDLPDMVRWIEDIAPDFVSIGADSGNNHLPEPSPSKVRELITELQAITEVKIKDNLTRLAQR
uniref:DUF5131 family protein n=1 Tax=viral metagenome TaxID=1070528 RepID=A0A6M3LJ98_9ZZZZ